ncbi:hypothetical protein [Brevundimonas sp.]|uniref:hypothetical protein n=1 Tax=Brevundimonas sp. TaxID=1871086 RepID=UPI003BABFDDF
MVSWWWVVPAFVAVIGGLFLLNGLASLFGGRVFGGLFKIIGGGAVLGVALAATLLAQNIQTYSRLTYERPVATIQLRQLGRQYYEVTLIQPPSTEGQPARTALYPVNGDEWRIEAQVLKWKPWANVLGLDTQYRLDRLSGRYQDIEQERTGARSVHGLSGGDQPSQIMGVALPWRVDAWDMARRYRRYVDAVDTLYGGAAYMPMADGARYEVFITQSGLIARPANAQARNASAGGWSMVN